MTCQSDIGDLPIKQFSVEIVDRSSSATSSKQSMNGLLDSPVIRENKTDHGNYNSNHKRSVQLTYTKRKLSYSSSLMDRELKDSDDIRVIVKELLKELVHKCAAVCRVSSSRMTIERSQRRSIRQRPACLICGARAEESLEFGCDRTHTDNSSRVYTCLYCGRIHPSEQTVIEHISVNHRTCNAALPLNRKPFLSMEIGPLTLSTDMSDVTKRTELIDKACRSLMSTMRCPICKMMFFPNRKNLVVHLMKYHRSSQLHIFRYEHGTSSYITISFERMLGYLILTAQANELKCIVEKETVTIGDLIKSTRRFNVPTFDERLLYRCIACKREFEMEEEIIRHCFCVHLRYIWDDFNWIKVTEHNSNWVRQYNCPRCSFSDSSLILINKHVQLDHAAINKELVFECNICKSQLSKDALEVHFTHSPCCQDPQFCISSGRRQPSEVSIEQCNSGPIKLQLTPATVLSFKRKRGGGYRRVPSREHRLAMFPPLPPLNPSAPWASKQELLDLLHNPKTEVTRVFACSICRFRSYSKDALHTHALVHNGETKPEGQLVCFRCPYRFDDVAALFEHEICHTSYSPYRCTGCRSVFFDRRVAVEHLSLCSGNSTAIASVQEPSVRALWKKCKPFNINLELNCYDLRELNSVKHELDNVSCPEGAANTLADHQILMNKALSAIANKCGGLLLLQEKHTEIQQEPLKRLWPMHRRRRRRRRLRYCPISARKRRIPSVHSLPAKRQARQCEICGFRYEGSKRLEYAPARQHQIENANSRLFAQRRYHCGRCPYASENSVDLRRHEYRHLKAGPFFCKLCRRDFCQQVDCINHIVHEHRETEALEDKVEFYVPPEEMIGLTTFHLRVKTRKRKQQIVQHSSEADSRQEVSTMKIKKEKISPIDSLEQFEQKETQGLMVASRGSLFHPSEYNILQASRRSTGVEQEAAHHLPELRSCCDRYVCVRCKLPYSEQDGASHDRLVLHTIYCHSSFRPFSCEYCKHRAVNKDAIRIHSMLKHGSEKFKQDIADENIQLAANIISGRFLCEMKRLTAEPRADTLTTSMMECGPLSYKCLRCCICFLQAERLAEHLQLARHVIFCRQCDQQGRRFSAFVRHYHRHHQAEWLIGDAGKYRCLVCYMDLGDEERLCDHLLHVHHLNPEPSGSQHCQLVHILLTSDAVFVYRDMSQTKLQLKVFKQAQQLASELVNQKPDDRLDQLEQILSRCPVCLAVSSNGIPSCVCEEYNLRCSVDGQSRLTSYGLRTLRFNLVSIVESCRNNAQISCGATIAIPPSLEPNLVRSD